MKIGVMTSALSAGTSTLHKKTNGLLPILPTTIVGAGVTTMNDHQLGENMNETDHHIEIRQATEAAKNIVTTYSVNQVHVIIGYLQGFVEN